MKFKGIEGSTKEFRDIFRDNDVSLSDYLEQPKPSVANWHFYFSAGLVFAAAVVLTLGLISSPQWNTLIFLCGFGATIWLTSSVQIKFGSAWASSFVLVGLFIILMIAFGQITPSEALQEVKSIKD